DSNHNRIIISSLSGAIQEVIGEGNIGLKDGDFQTARFFRPQGLCYDPANEVLYVADTENHAVRKIDLKTRKVSTVAGNGKQAAYPPSGGVGKDVSLSSPWDVLLLDDTLYVAMAGTHQLWSIDLKTQRAKPYAGTAGENLRDGPREQALLAQPSGLTTDGSRIYFTDSEVSALRFVDTRENTVGTVIGEGLFEFGDVDGTYPQARLQHPLGVAYKDGYVYVADTYNHKIKRIDPKTRRAETFIGTGKRGMDDGPAKQATFNEPNGLTFARGKMYITDTNNHLIRVFDPASDKLSTLRLTGIQKLVSRKISKFTGRETRLSQQQIAPGVKALHIEIRLPKGTRLNKNAPFHIVATSDRPESVGVGPLNISAPSSKLTIPISPRAGTANITVKMSINYCAEGNEGLCYFKEAKLVVPMKVTPSGASSVFINYAL
ncbi:MAG TPA: NHL repeat-containing protein, partial [Chthonomonadales bacterium]|nr:NHL repeat-containing protein [Chthonomonadales bacterium]